MTTPDSSNFAYGVVQCSPHGIPQLMGEIRDLLADKTLTPRTILCVNAHIYNLACRDAVLRGNLNAARIVAADGMAIVWTARWFGAAMSGRCNMTESLRAFIEAPDMPPSRGIIIGCAPAEAEAARREINRRCAHCIITAAYSGFLNDEEYRKILSRHQDTDLILLGMGTPKTEHVARLAETACPRAVVWGAGGGTVLIYAGAMREAPVLWRRLGIQWLHRLISEPGKVWRRYVLGNPLFLFRIARAAVRARFRAPG